MLDKMALGTFYARFLCSPILCKKRIMTHNLAHPVTKIFSELWPPTFL